jgi:serine phosphatase RsbU (regulator of sigma subunit)
MKNKLQDLNENLEIKVEERTEELQAANEELEAINESLHQTMDELQLANEKLIEARDELWGEMELAKKIQTVLLPKDPRINRYEIAAYMNPADSVGGDYYDIIHASGTDWIVIGDVSGHGVPAGLIMMMVQTAIHTTLKKNPRMKPSELIETINSAIYENIKLVDEDKYMTITVLACQEGGVFKFAGLHQDIMIYRNNSKLVELVETKGMWIGILDSIHLMNEDSQVKLDIGDTMLLYTDGITEARRNGDRPVDSILEYEDFGADRLKNVLGDLGTARPEEIKAGILEVLNSYSCNDDVTFLVLKRAG